LLNKLETTNPLVLREEFLDTSAREMKGLSALERHETIVEMRAHLVALAAAHEELGLSPIDAMVTAIAGFGDARSIGKEIRQASGSVESRLPLIVASGSGAVVCSMLATAADLTMVALKIVSNRSQEMGVIGALIGLTIGVSLYRRRRSPGIAALRAGIIVPSALLLFVAILNHSFLTLSFFSVCFAFYGVVAALSALVSTWFIGLADRMQDKTPTPV